MKYLIIDKRQRVNKTIAIPTASVRIIEELEKRNISYHFIYNDKIEFLFQKDSTQILVDGKDITDYSHIIFRGHSLDNEKEYQYKRYIIDYIDTYNENHPEEKILIQNSEAMKRLPYYNKIALAMLFQENNIPQFQTYYRTDGEYLANRNMLNEYPLILKEYTGRNRVEIINGEEKIKKNVFKIDSDTDWDNIEIEKKDLKDFFIQEFSESGKDMRMFVKNGEVIAGWTREATKGFMTVNKGIYKTYNQPDDEVRDISRKVAKILHADFLAVDFMYMNERLCVQEISFHPGFKAYETKTEGERVNIAEAIIDAF